jgi:hypothetical protein
LRDRPLFAALLVLEVDAVRAEEWASAAAHLGNRPVSPWLAALARRRVYQLRWDLPPPRLRWRRRPFRTLVLAGERTIRTVAVTGLVSGPFGIYRGSPKDLDVAEWTLALTVSCMPLASVGRMRDAMALAAKVAPLRVRWEAATREEIGGQDWGGASWLLAKAEYAWRRSRGEIHGPR